MSALSEKAVSLSLRPKTKKSTIPERIMLFENARFARRTACQSILYFPKYPCKIARLSSRSTPAVT